MKSEMPYSLDEDYNLSSKKYYLKKRLAFTSASLILSGRSLHIFSEIGKSGREAS